MVVVALLLGLPLLPKGQAQGTAPTDFLSVVFGISV